MKQMSRAFDHRSWVDIVQRRGFIPYIYQYSPVYIIKLLNMHIAKLVSFDSFCILKTSHNMWLSDHRSFNIFESVKKC